MIPDLVKQKVFLYPAPVTTLPYASSPTGEGVCGTNIQTQLNKQKLLKALKLYIKSRYGENNQPPELLNHKL